jgi:hypothetical protein
VTNRPETKRHELTAEERRAGGRKSGEVRRSKRYRSWSDAYLDAVNADPATFVAGLLESPNAMVRVKALELAQAAQEAGLKARAIELDERERELEEAAGALAIDRMEREWAQDERDQVAEEIAALEAARDELRAIVTSEGLVAGYELELEI